MQSAFENSLSDLAAENYTQAYPVKPWWENHTPACLAARESERVALAEYEKKYPGFCRTCGGTGIETWRENAAPHGSGEFWPMDVSDCCPECVGAGKCPRCGKSENFYDDDPDTLKCFSCDWTPETAGAPEVLSPYDCGCDLPENE